MVELSKVVAAPQEVKIIDGETMETFYPLRFLEWGKLEQWMRESVITAAANSIKGIDRRDSVIIMKSAMREASKINVMACIRSTVDSEAEDSIAFLQTTEGMLRTIHLSLRDGPSNIAKSKYTLEALDEMFNSDSTILQQAYGIVLYISFPGMEVEDEAEEEEKEEKEDKDPNSSETKT